VYLDGQDVPLPTLRQVIRDQTLARQIQPVLCGSGREHSGIQPLMDAVCYYLPNPLERPAVKGRNPKKKEKEESRKPDAKEPFAGLVFKIAADTHGDLYYVRIYSGSLKANSRVLNPECRLFNPPREVKEFASKIYHIHADPKNREDMPIAYAGDIVGVIGPKDSITGDTLCDPQHPVVLEQIQFAEAVVAMSIEPESSADKDKLTDSLDRLKREDPTFTWRVDADTGQMLMSGMGILHLEVKKHRLERDFRLKVRVSKPRVSYRETLKKSIKTQGECVKQTGTTGLFAKVSVDFEPIAVEKGVDVVNKIPAEMLPGELMAAVEQGIRFALQSGELGYPVIGVKATLRSAQMQEGVSNDIAFQAAGADAVNRALKGNMTLLEPVMRTEVMVPEEYLGPVTADMNARRAEIREVITRGKLRVIEALVPLAKMFDYSDKVRSLTAGRATWTMEPSAYAPVDAETRRQMESGGW
jgi:elongation factor G